MNTNPNSKTLRLGLIGVGTYGGTLLAGILRAIGEHSDIPIERIAVYDRNQEKLRPFADDTGKCLSICSSAQEVIDLADVNIIGVSSSQIPALLSELGFDKRSPASERTQFLFMDGQQDVHQLAAKGRLIYGNIMFTPWVRYGEGIIGFWPGTLLSNTTDKLRRIFEMLGRVWIASNPALLPTIRATAGCGIAMVGVVLSNMRTSFVGLGLTSEQADEAIRSLISGLAEYSSSGNSVDDLAQSVCSNENSFTQVMLASDYTDRLQNDISGMMSSLKAVIENG
jgi:pyrroline-5-carboxylate reductase